MWAEFIAEKDTKRSLPAKYATKNTLNIEVIYVRNRFGQVRSGHIKVEHTRLDFMAVYYLPLFSLYFPCFLYIHSKSYFPLLGLFYRLGTAKYLMIYSKNTQHA